MNLFTEIGGDWIKSDFMQNIYSMRVELELVLLHIVLITNRKNILKLCIYNTLIIM